MTLKDSTETKRWAVKKVEEVGWGLGLGAWPFPLYLRQQLEEDNIFSSLHTRIDRASSSVFFFCFFLLLLV